MKCLAVAGLWSFWLRIQFASPFKWTRLSLFVSARCCARTRWFSDRSRQLATSVNALWSGPRFAVCWASAGQCCLLCVCSAFALRCTFCCVLELGSALLVVRGHRYSRRHLLLRTHFVCVFEQKRGLNLGNQCTLALIGVCTSQLDLISDKTTR